jgi:small nuclear ribonucleoprotein B and B'
LSAGPGISRPGGRGAPIGLTGPAAGVGGPAPPGFAGAPGGFGGFPGGGRGGPREFLFSQSLSMRSTHKLQ